MRKPAVILAAIILLAVLGVGFWVMKNGDSKTNSTNTSPETSPAPSATTNTTPTTSPSPTSSTTPSTTATPAPAPTTTPPAANSSESVEITDFAFSPSALSVKKGTTVKWTNQDSTAHTVTSTDGGPLDSATLNNGQSYSFTFNETGTFSYHCAFHANMTAKVIVTD